MRPSNYPGPDARDVLVPLAVEGTDEANMREFGIACFVVEGRGKHARVCIEHRRLTLDKWPIDKSCVLLDANASLADPILQAALPSWKVRLFTLDVLEPLCIRRVHVRTRSMTRRNLLVRPKNQTLPPAR